MSGPGGRSLPVAVLAGAIAVVLLGGVAVAVARSGGGGGTSAVGGNGATTTAPAGPAAPVPRISIVAQAILPTVAVYNAPDAPQPAQSLPNPQPSGAPLVFLVREQRADWLNVLLPAPPAGSTGWIRRSDVSLTQHDFEIVVELGAHRITVLKSGQVLLAAPISVGAANTPPPGKAYYLKELVQPPGANTVYGAYGYGLSGFPNVLTDVAAGKGLTGIHGTNDASRLGRSVSPGSIGMSNEGIAVLATTLPLGVPVDVRP